MNANSSLCAVTWMLIQYIHLWLASAICSTGQDKTKKGSVCYFFISIVAFTAFTTTITQFHGLIIYLIFDAQMCDNHSYRHIFCDGYTDFTFATYKKEEAPNLILPDRWTKTILSSLCLCCKKIIIGNRLTYKKEIKNKTIHSSAAFSVKKNVTD